MKLFIETENLSEAQEARDLGIFDGVSCALSLGAGPAGESSETIRELARLFEGLPMLVAVMAHDRRAMMREAETLVALAGNLVPHLPGTREGIRTCKELASRGMRMSVGLCFQPLHALTAAKAGATYVGPFLSRGAIVGKEAAGSPLRGELGFFQPTAEAAPDPPLIETPPIPVNGRNGLGILEDVRKLLTNYGYGAELLVAGLTEPRELVEAALAGSHAAAVPFGLIDRLVASPLPVALPPIRGSAGPSRATGMG